MSLMRSEYRELGLELVELGENTSHHPKKPHMEGEEKRDGIGIDPIKLLLEESIMRQRNKIMDNFDQILRRMLTVANAPSMRICFRGVNPFKVKVKFYIPLFEGNIDADALEKWLSLLERYFCFKKNSTVKISPSLSLSPSPMSNIGGMGTMRGTQRMNLRY